MRCFLRIQPRRPIIYSIYHQIGTISVLSEFLGGSSSGTSIYTGFEIEILARTERGKAAEEMSYATIGVSAALRNLLVSVSTISYHTGTRGELAGPDWIGILIKFIVEYLILLSALLFPSQIYFYLILDLQSGQYITYEVASEIEGNKANEIRQESSMVITIHTYLVTESPKYQVVCTKTSLCDKTHHKKSHP